MNKHNTVQIYHFAVSNFWYLASLVREGSRALA